MAVNKVIYGGNTLVDLTSDTVTAADLADGVKATGADGNPVIGLMQKVTIDAELSTTSTNPVQNKAIKEALDGKLGKNETAVNASKVNNLTVETAVPKNAKFTDTVYTHPSTHPASMITGLATVATSGSYADLSDKPTIPAAYSLPDATTSVKGGVKIGSNLTVSSGTISLTKANVTSALGYTPPTTDTNTHYTTGLIVGKAATDTANAAATNGNVFLNLKDDSTIRNSHKIVGSGATTVTSDASGNITISSTNTVYTHPSSGVTAGTYRSVTVNAQGHVTDASNPTLPISQGGTGATTASDALSNLGGVPTSDVANSANKIPRYNSDGHLVLPDGSEFWIG